MVRAFNTSRLLLIVVLAFVGSSCSQKWWAENNPISVIRAKLSGDSCPAFNLIIKGSEQQSIETMECYIDKTNKVWTQVEGEKKESLSEDEIRTLVRRKVIKLPWNKPNETQEEVLEGVLDAKKLIGFPRDVSKVKMDEWITWARKSRPLLWKFYQKYRTHDDFFTPSVTYYYQDLRDLVTVLNDGLRRMNWSMDSHDLAFAFMSAFRMDDPVIRGAMAPAAEVGINILNAFCPTFRQADLWNSWDMARCFDKMLAELEVGADYFEYLANPVLEMPEERMQRIIVSIDKLRDRVQIWFNQSTLTPIFPARFADVARRILYPKRFSGGRSVNPDSELIDNFMSSLKVVRRFSGSRSTEEAIYPEGMVRIYKTLSEASKSTVRGISFFLDAANQGTCLNPDARDWRTCTIANYQGAPPELERAARLKNLNHGTYASPLNGGEFSRINFYYQIAGQAIDAFHDDCEHLKKIYQSRGLVFQLTNGMKCDEQTISTRGSLFSNLKDPNDSLVQLIDVGTKALAIVQQFFENVSRKVDGRPLRDFTPLIDPNWNVSGLAQLVAMTSGILGNGDTYANKSRGPFGPISALVSNFLDVTPELIELDQMGVASAITAVSDLSSYRRGYLSLNTNMAMVKSGDEPARPAAVTFEDYDWRLPRFAEYDDMYVSRSLFFKHLPDVLEKFFPRTYASCNEFGFEKSCQIAFEALIPDSPKHPDQLNPGDLDVVSILAMGAEGLLDYCDRSHDNRLSWNFFDGNDELDCAETRAKEVIKRLIEAKIIRMDDPKNAERTQILLNLQSANAIFRIAMKSAMMRGSSEYLLLNIPLFWFRSHASLGSIYGLISDIADPTRARSIK